MPTSLHLIGDQSLILDNGGVENTSESKKTATNILPLSYRHCMKGQSTIISSLQGSQENLIVKYGKKERKTTHSIKLSILILSRKETAPLSANAEFLHWAQAQDRMCKEGGKLETTHLLPLFIYQILEYLILIDIYFSTLCQISILYLFYCIFQLVHVRLKKRKVREKKILEVSLCFFFFRQRKDYADCNFFPPNHCRIGAAAFISHTKHFFSGPVRQICQDSYLHTER